MTNTQPLPDGIYSISATADTFTQPISISVQPGGTNGGTVNGILVGIETGCPSAGPTPPFGTNTPCSPDNGGQFESPALNTQIGRYPDFSGAFVNSAPCVPLAPQTSCGVDGTPDNQGYPWQGNMSTLGNYSGPRQTSGLYVYGCGTTGGNNDYLSNFQLAASNDPAWGAAVESGITADFVPFRSNLYYIRLNWEWSGTWFCWSPWGFGQPTLDGAPVNDENHPSISPQTWSQATINTILHIRKVLPGVKIFVDGANNSVEQAYTDPLVNYVDGWSKDIYFSNGIDHNGSAQTWTVVGGDGTPTFCQQFPGPTGCTSLPFLAAYARSTGKPIVINEWADEWNDGYITPRFAQWMVQNNVVAQSYWDSNVGCPGADTGPGGTLGCSLLTNTVTAAAYKAAFGAPVSYTGNFFAHFPIPPANPPGNPLGY